MLLVELGPCSWEADGTRHGLESPERCHVLGRGQAPVPALDAIAVEAAALCGFRCPCPFLLRLIHAN